MEAPALALTPMAQNTTSIAHFDNTFNIKEFLRRPIKLWSDQISVTGKQPLQEFVEDTPQSATMSWDLPHAVLAGGHKIEKVTNHQYFRADVHMKLVVNASPFVSGRFYLTYSPYESQISDARRQIWASRAGVTAYPGVEVDIQLDNSVEIVIPFASYKESYVLTTEIENFVTVNLFPLTEVRGVAGTYVDMAMYAWFDNIELNIPTLKSATGAEPQVIERPLNDFEKRKIEIGRVVERLKHSVDPRTREAYNTVMQYVRGNMQIQKENLTQSGPIGSIASTVKDIAGIVGTAPIPIVNEIATGVSWVADIVGGIANIFGWSKPNSYAQVTPLQNVPGKFYTHFDSEDQSVSLSLTAKNELDKLDNIFPSAADEMNLSYVAANPAVKHIIPWISRAKAGQAFTNEVLAVIPVGIGSFTAKTIKAAEFFTDTSILDPSAMYLCPGDTCAEADGGFIPYMAFNAFLSGSGKNVYRSELRARGQVNRFLLATAPCEYVSQLFKHWRATICFKISIVKTAFHTGRLEIFFDPGMYENIDKSDFIDPNKDKYKDIDTTNNYKYILDLTNDTEITIKIPFVSEKLFLSTKGLNGGAAMPTVEQVADSIIGSLVIRPVSNLMRPDTVSDTVDIVVWKWAEDVVLTCPINAGGSNLTIYDKNSSDIVYPDTKVPEIDHDILRNLPVEFNGTKYTMQCGAKRSIREVGDSPFSGLVVDGSMQINIGNKAEGNVITFFNTTSIEAENMNACKNASGERLINLRPLLRVFRDYKEVKTLDITIDAQEEDNKNNPDYLSYLSYMYRFFRGGFRYKVISDGTQVRSRLLENENNTGKLTPSHITFPQINPMHEVSIPYYSRYRKLPISSSKDGIMKLNIKGDNTTPATLLRAGNDDLTFGWLMGTPQLVPGNLGVKWLSIEPIENVGDSVPLCEAATKRLATGEKGKPVQPPKSK